MNPIIRLYKDNGKYVIKDNNGNVVVENIHNADEHFCSEGSMVISFMTENNEYSYINTCSGLYFDRYSYKEYDVVCELVPNSQIYKCVRSGKLGLINVSCSNNKTIDCIFDELEFLTSNVFINGDIVKLKKDGKYSLIHVRDGYNKSGKYDCIYTPIQPLNQFVVCNDGRFGFIDAYSLKEIVKPTFESVESLCNYFNYDINKYIRNIYITNVKLNFKILPMPNECRSYIIDTNKIVKGKWGGKEDLIADRRTGEVYMYCLYYSSGSISLPINMYGYFYNIFDSRKYDVVIHVIENFYLILKGKKYGLIDDEFHTILDISYKNIKLVKFSQLNEIPLFVVTCQKGQFLFNAITGMQTRVYDSLSYHDDAYISGCYRNYLLYEEHGKFGLLSPEGNVIIKAKFDLYQIDFGERDKIERGHVYFQEIFHGHKYGFYIENKKFYGKVPVEKYDSCIRIGGRNLNSYYIVKINGKYGLLNHRCDEIAIPLLDDMFFAKKTMVSIFRVSGRCRRLRGAISETFLIGLIENKYHLYSITSLYDLQDAKLIVSGCDEMEFVEDKTLSYGLGNEYPYIRFRKNGVYGYVNEDGIVISPETFDEIKPIEVSKYSDCYYLISKDGKMGLLNAKRKVIFPCIYDDIKHVTPRSALVSENGIEKEVRYNNMVTSQDDGSSDMIEEVHHYSRYVGSYAQSEMGYSDEDIDTIFDGDPDAYWNID